MGEGRWSSTGTMWWRWEARDLCWHTSLSQWRLRVVYQTPKDGSPRNGRILLTLEPAYTAYCEPNIAEWINEQWEALLGNAFTYLHMHSCNSSAAAETNLEAGILDSCVRSRKLCLFLFSSHCDTEVSSGVPTVCFFYDPGYQIYWFEAQRRIESIKIVLWRTEVAFTIFPDKSEWWWWSNGALQVGLESWSSTRFIYVWISLSIVSTSIVPLSRATSPTEMTIDASATHTLASHS